MARGCNINQKFGRINKLAFGESHPKKLVYKK